jgi:predicted RNA-binding protein YlxR (DUF448 family)
MMRLFCRHNHQVFLRNVYGDEINELNARSLWLCTKCKKITRSQKLAPFSAPLALGMSLQEGILTIVIQEPMEEDTLVRANIQVPLKDIMNKDYSAII